MIDLFISYAHQDAALRVQLEVHLAMLKRSGLIRAWHDRRITAGQELHHEISEHLEGADVILLLLSPHFLASDYCYDVEAKRALERHEKQDAVVIPVILEPCDWLHSPFAKLRATPADGKPVTRFPNVNDAFLEVVTDVRNAAAGLGKAEPPVRAEPSAVATPTLDARSSNLRLKKAFTDRERDAFVDDAYAYIEKFFENSLAELALRNQGVEVRFKRDGGSGFTAAIYSGGEKMASCHIWQGGRNAFGGDISYSASDSTSRNSINDGMSVGDDGYALGLKPMGMSTFGRPHDELLTQHGAAECFWDLLVARLQ